MGAELPFWACSTPKTKLEMTKPHEKTAPKLMLWKPCPAATPRVWVQLERHVGLHWKELWSFAKAPSGKVHPACLHPEKFAG